MRYVVDPAARYVRLENSPSVEDLILFELRTYNEDGVLKNPYQIDKVTIYYIEKHNSDNERPLENKYYKPDLEKEYEKLQTDPTAVSKLKNLRKKMEETATVVTFYYSEARIVSSASGPLWSADGKVRKIVNIVEAEKEVEGKFAFFWKPTGIREGTYMIRWDWRVAEKAKPQSAEKIFTLNPANERINSVYSKFVPREKYDFLMTKYIPPHYFKQTRADDLTPEVMTKFNKAVAQAFLELDDLAVGLIDMLDPVYTHENFLPLLANFLNVELKTQSTAAWRNQIKNSVSLYKRKGTLEGLSKALDKAGFRLLKLTNLWQVVSPYSWTDGFVLEKDIGANMEIVGYLSKVPVSEEVKVSIKATESNDYFDLPANSIKLQEITGPENKIAVIWNGGELNPAIELFQGDVIRVSYKYNEMPKEAKSIEDYIEGLPLADSRDETKVKYPLKNWNVKLIEEDDPLFNLLVKKRNPYYNPMVYGKIRTTFLYSEKVFNMDTYNGSLFNSNNPCDLDKNFLDICSGGMSSKFNIHVEVGSLSNDKIKEVKDIVTDFSPFHAILHKMKISTKFVDLLPSPAERIKNEIKFKPGANTDKVGCAERIMCKVKFKDGSEAEGQLL